MNFIQFCLMLLGKGFVIFDWFLFTLAGEPFCILYDSFILVACNKFSFFFSVYRLFTSPPFHSSYSCRSLLIL